MTIGLSTYAFFWQWHDTATSPLSLTDMIEKTAVWDVELFQICDYPAIDSYDDTAPSCTYVSAVIKPDEVTIGWVGDSRAYWIGATEALLLTVDAARGHALTAWLGADAGEVVPHVTTYCPAEPGVVVLCSDGLWNYLGSAEDLADLTRPLAAEPMSAAAELVRLAIGMGGHDNVTVVVASLPPTSKRSDRR